MADRQALTVRETRLIDLQTTLTTKKIKETPTKRDQFAAMAMQGMMASMTGFNQNSAKRCFEIADLMIAESKKTRVNISK